LYLFIDCLFSKDFLKVYNVLLLIFRELKVFFYNYQRSKKIKVFRKYSNVFAFQEIGNGLIFSVLAKN